MRKRDLQAGIWLVGLGFLFLTDTFWPGILILVGLSILIDSLYKPQLQEKKDPDEFVYRPRSNEQEEVSQVNAAQNGSQSPDQPAAPSPTWRDNTVLPPRCPRCGAPVEAELVRWTGANSADCPFCSGSLFT